MGEIKSLGVLGIVDRGFREACKRIGFLGDKMLRYFYFFGGLRFLVFMYRGKTIGNFFRRFVLRIKEFSWELWYYML